VKVLAIYKPFHLAPEESARQDLRDLLGCAQTATASSVGRETSEELHGMVKMTEFSPSPVYLFS